MVARKETLIKWVLFGAGAVLFCLLQSALQQIRIWGVFPFLFPALVAVLGMFEGPVPGAVFGLVMGVLCDLTVAAPIPCFYTLVFPLAGLFAGAIALSWLPAGFPCSLIVTLLAFGLTDGFHCLILALNHQSIFPAALLTAGKETAVTLPFLLLIFLLLRAIHRKCHMYD